MRYVSISPSIVRPTQKDTAFLQDEGVRIENAFALLFNMSTPFYRSLADIKLEGILFFTRGRMEYLCDEGLKGNEEYQSLKCEERAVIDCSCKVARETKELLEEYSRFYCASVTLDSMIKTKEFLNFIEKKGYQLPSVLAEKLQMQDIVPKEIQTQYKEAAEKESKGRKKYLLALLAAANGKTNPEILKELWPNDTSKSNARNNIKKGYDIASQNNLPSLDEYLTRCKRLPI